MDFMNIQALWLVLVVPPAVALFVLGAYARRQLYRQRYGDEHLIAERSATPNRKSAVIRACVLGLSAVLVVLATARPTIENGRAEFPEGTTDVVVLVDVSRSMAALDYKGKIPQGPFDHGTRLDMARHLLYNDVIPSLGANRLGIVSYAGSAFPLAFLTGDVSAVDWVMKRSLVISSAPGDGSALVQAFQMAFQIYDLDSKPGNRKVAVLFSDGGNDDGLDQLNAVIQALKERNIELIVVGLGKQTKSPIPIRELSPQDRARYEGEEFYTVDGETATSALDENVMRLFANRTGGKYIRVTEASDFSFDSLAQRLDMKYRKGKEEVFVYPLAAGFVLLFFGWFMTGEVAQATLLQRITRSRKDKRKQKGVSDE